MFRFSRSDSKILVAFTIPNHLVHPNLIIEESNIYCATKGLGMVFVLASHNLNAIDSTFASHRTTLQTLTNYWWGRNFGEQAVAVINHEDKWDSNPVVASALPDATSETYWVLQKVSVPHDVKVSVISQPNMI